MGQSQEAQVKLEELYRNPFAIIPEVRAQVPSFFRLSSSYHDATKHLAFLPA
jgi:hypothetical protein